MKLRRLNWNRFIYQCWTWCLFAEEMRVDFMLQIFSMLCLLILFCNIFFISIVEFEMEIAQSQEIVSHWKSKTFDFIRLSISVIFLLNCFGIFFRSHSSADHTTICLRFPSARTTASASSIRRIGRHARLVAFESACWLECQRAARATADDRIGSKFTAYFRSSSKRKQLTVTMDIRNLQLYRQTHWISWGILHIHRIYSQDLSALKRN